MPRTSRPRFFFSDFLQLLPLHTLAQLRAGTLSGTTRLDLSENLTVFPPEIFALADSLEILNLSGNALAALPADLGRLHKLRVLFCSDNKFEEVPAALGQCPALEMVGFKANRIRTLPAAALPPRLRWLILTDNQLETLPAELGACPHLQKLLLAGNRLRELPATLANCHRLELLRVAANQLSALPDWLLTLPRLAWLAYGGNPFYAAAEAAAEAHNPGLSIAWADLTVQQPLGEGASGIIYQARWQRAAGLPRPVALKVFKGAVTSDGRPHSEMVACLSAGPHPNLVAVYGRLQGHPAAAEGLVLKLVAPEFGNLAGPPSFASCTRDVYAPGTAFALPVVLQIAHGIASAVAHLHAQGILHGDLYAHNILATTSGRSLLSDFGAASFWASAGSAPALQRLEARAFGCLLEELLAHGEASAPAAPPAAAQLLAALYDLQRRCQQPTVAARPLFAEIERELAALQRAFDAAWGGFQVGVQRVEVL